MSSAHEMNDYSKDGNMETFSPVARNASNEEPQYTTVHEHKQDGWQNFKDSFKRDPNAGVAVSKGVDPNAPGGYDLEGAAAATANSGLARKLKGRHLQMIAIGGSIGKIHFWFRGLLPRLTLDTRYWSFRGIRKRVVSRGSGIPAYRLCSHRSDAVLHGTRSW